MLSAISPEVVWQLLSGPDSPLDSNSPQLRLLHMEQAENMWITIAREVYVGYKDLPPFNKDLHYNMLEMEREEEVVSTQNLVSLVPCRQDK